MHHASSQRAGSNHFVLVERRCSVHPLHCFSFFLRAAGEGELFDFGQECLDRIALSLGAKTVAAAASALLPVLLADGDWKKRHAALITIAQARPCSSVYVCV